MIATVTVFPSETTIIPDFPVVTADLVTVQATNLSSTETVDVLLYTALGTEALAPSSLPDLTGIPPGKPRIVQVDTRNLSRMEVRGTSTGAASVKVVTT